MSSIKKNFGWNILLTISGYLFPLLTFPYVTRVLGAGNLGIANFALSIVDYAILFSSLGMTMVGIRYIAQTNGDRDKRNKVFSELVSIHLTLSLVVLCIYSACVFIVPQLQEQKMLYLVGASKIILNVFVIEWLFQGLQDFRYVTIRTLLIRTLYVILIFVFVRSAEDYDNYFYVTIAQVAINCIVNWRYAKRFVSFRFSLRGIKEYSFPIVSMGINHILLSFYSTFNIMYLGFRSTNEEVGYFTTATRLYTIFISLLTAYNSVFVPYLNSLYSQGEIERFKQIITKSLSLITMLALPIITGGIILAPHIIRLIAGKGYEQATLPFQIIIIQVLIVGITQILENQILLSYKKFKEILITTATTATMSLLIIILWVPVYGAIASAMAVAVPHVFEILLLYYFAKKTISFTFPFRSFIYNLLSCIPIGIVCVCLSTRIDNYIVVLGTSIITAAIYYLIIQIFVIKDDYIIQQLSRLKTIAK